jgi:sarcosine oxidase subunit gamma
MANALRHETPFDAMLGEAPREIAARGLTISAAPVAAQIAITGDMAAAAAALGAIINQVPPAQPNQIAGKEPYLLWLAPDKRLIVAEVADRFELGQRLTESLAGKFAAVSDVSDGVAVLDILGPRAREIIAMGCGLDLDPQLFTPSVSARTLLAGQPVMLYPLALPEAKWEPGRPHIPQPPNRGYRVHVDRAILHYLWKWLAQASTAIS